MIPNNVKLLLVKKDGSFFFNVALAVVVSILLFIAIISNFVDIQYPSPANYHDSIATKVHLARASTGQLFENKAIIRPFDIEPRRRLWKRLHEKMKDAEPKLEFSLKSLLPNGGIPELRFVARSADGYPLPQRLDLGDEELNELREKHSKFKNFVVDDSHELPYEAGSKGIVTTANPNSIPALLASLYMLQQSGSTLPVEVFIYDSTDTNVRLCREVLPLANANCVFFESIFEPSKPDKQLIDQQYKILSILFSSFENVLYLDADNFALRNPDVLFESEVFTEKGFLVWPDYWQLTYSPAFFNITSQNTPEKINRPSMDAGQMLISKKSHTKALMLAAYYNFYGPDLYYTLLAQGGPGEGDKETYIPAMSILNLPYRMLTTAPRPWNYTNPDGKVPWTGAKLLIDPIWDFTLPKSTLFNYSWPGQLDPPGNSHMFMHSYKPRLDPLSVVGIYGLGWDAKHQPRRLWSSLADVIMAIGYDVEPMIWMSLQKSACELEKVGWKLWENQTFCPMLGSMISQLKSEGKLDTSFWERRRW